MRCISCGHDIDERAVICNYCGMHLVPENRDQMKFSGPYNEEPSPGQPQQYMQPQQYVQRQQYVQPQQMQYGQMPQPQMMQFGHSPVQQTYPGYENKIKNSPDPGKKRYIPNVPNIIAILLAVTVMFIPYAHLGDDIRSISNVFGLTFLYVTVGALLVIADIVCAFFNKAACYIVDLVISLAVGGALLLEFILAVVDLGKIDGTANAGLMYGAWISLVGSIILIASVPLWWIITRKRKNA